LIDFSEYEEDIESFMTIDLISNKYSKKTNRLDLTKMVFGVMKSMLKKDFLNYVSHSDFKALIFKIY